jgi:hypothetical protein
MTNDTNSYIITHGNFGYEIHGPFETNAHLSAYASWWQFALHDDNPCWNVTELSDAHAAPEVIAPPTGDAWTKILADYRTGDHAPWWPRPADGGPRHNFVIIFPPGADGYQVGFKLIGPFSHEEYLSAYGHYWEAQNPDNLSWFSLYVADPSAAPRVTTPADADWPAIWQAHEEAQQAA